MLNEWACIYKDRSIITTLKLLKRLYRNKIIVHKLMNKITMNKITDQIQNYINTLRKLIKNYHQIAVTPFSLLSYLTIIINRFLAIKICDPRAKTVFIPQLIHPPILCRQPLIAQPIQRGYPLINRELKTGDWGWIVRQLTADYRSNCGLEQSRKS